MLLHGSKAPELTQLKQVINSIDNENVQLQVLAEYETSRSLRCFEILTRICELIPLATSIEMVKKTISTFAGKLVNLLEEKDVLQDAAMSRNCLKCLKSFWSLCSRQQNVISYQCFGKWHPALLEEITPLASIFIDLSISAHGHDENKLRWSKKLYSWLNFDLTDRAIRIALLEVVGHKKVGAEIAGPILSQVLRRNSSELSDPDYLLHFLLLNKWQGLTAVSEIAEESKLIKAPPTFLSWVKTYLKSCFIPEDMKGASVSRFLLDLNTDDALESLTDALQMALFPEEAKDEPLPLNTGPSRNMQFVVDKKGAEINTNKDRTLSDKEDGSLMVNSRAVTDAHDKTRKKKDENSVEKGASPQKKKKSKSEYNNTELNNCEMTGFFLDRSNAKPEDTITAREGLRQILLGDEEPVPRKRKCSLAKEDSDFGSGEVLMKKRRRKSDEESGVGSESLANGEGEDCIPQRLLRPRNLATAVLKRKNILISDPVALSYFTGDGDINLADNDGESDAKSIVEEKKESKIKKSSDDNMSLLTSQIGTAVRSSPRISKLNRLKDCLNETESKSPKQEKVKTTPLKQIHDSPRTPKRNGSLKKQTESDSPRKLRGSSTPQNSMDKSVKKKSPKSLQKICCNNNKY